MSLYSNFTDLANSIKTALEKKADKTEIPSIVGLEETANKVTSLSAQSTDTQYPSAKCVYDLIGGVESALAALIGGES